MTQPPMTPGYPQPQPPSQGTNALAVISMVLGILSCIGFCKWWIGAPFGVLAIVLSVLASGQIKQAGGSGGGMAKAGLILGIIGVVLAVIVMIIVMLFFKAASAGGNFLQKKAQELQKRAEEEQKKAEERQRQHQTPSTAPDSTTMAQPLEWNVVAKWHGGSLERRLIVELPPRVLLMA